MALFHYAVIGPDKFPGIFLRESIPRFTALTLYMRQIYTWTSTSKKSQKRTNNTLQKEKRLKTCFLNPIFEGAEHDNRKAEESNSDTWSSYEWKTARMC